MRSAHKISIQGPRKLFTEDSCSSEHFNVVHELTTNAAKYSSLSVIKGRLLGVRCTDDGTGSLDILWQETCGPRGNRPLSFEFSWLVIHQQLKHELVCQRELGILLHRRGFAVRFQIALQQ